MSLPGVVVDIGVFALGVALLVAGGETLVRGAVALAARLGVAPLVIGLTVVAFGTSAPELALNIVAAANGNVGLSFGNVVGSNIANVGLILGLSALIKPMRVQASLVRREIPIMLAATVLFVALGYAPPGVAGAAGVSRADAGVLLAVFALVLWWMLRMARRDASASALLAGGAPEDAEGAGKTPLGLTTVLIVFGLVMLVGGGKLAEVGAVGVAAALGMSNELIGLTVVALATSLPELSTSLIAAKRGQVDLAVGNVVGSNIFNILLVMGATGLVTPVPLPGLAAASLGAMALLSVLLWPMSLTAGRNISRFEGGVLLAVYAGYLGFEVWSAVGIGGG